MSGTDDPLQGVRRSHRVVRAKRAEHRLETRMLHPRNPELRMGTGTGRLELCQLGQGGLDGFGGRRGRRGIGCDGFRCRGWSWGRGWGDSILCVSGGRGLAGCKAAPKQARDLGRVGVPDPDVAGCLDDCGEGWGGWRVCGCWLRMRLLGRRCGGRRDRGWRGLGWEGWRDRQLGSGGCCGHRCGLGLGRGLRRRLRRLLEDGCWLRLGKRLNSWCGHMFRCWRRRRGGFG